MDGYSRYLKSKQFPTWNIEGKTYLTVVVFPEGPADVPVHQLQVVQQRGQRLTKKFKECMVYMGTSPKDCQADPEQYCRCDGRRMW